MGVGKEERGRGGISASRFIFSLSNSGNRYLSLLFSLASFSPVSQLRHTIISGESSTNVYVYVHTRRSVKRCAMSRDIELGNGDKRNVCNPAERGEHVVPMYGNERVGDMINGLGPSCTKTIRTRDTSSTGTSL